MPLVLDIGNCGFDQSRMQRLLTQHFDVTVNGVDTLAQLQQAATAGDVALILVNRVFDRDGSDGLEFLATLAQTAQLASVPKMLITNYPEYQARAVASGAQPGFGKNDLGSTAWVDLLSQYLPRKTS
jgi:CheY-like chemotaxis protein